jgi:hypothetical protein
MPPHRAGAAAVACLVAALCGALVSGDVPPHGGPSMPDPASRDAAVRHVDREALMATVRALSAPDLAGRRMGTPGGAAARRLIVRELEAAGLAPAFRTGFVQPFRTGRAVEGANVSGIVRGTGGRLTAIVVSAHYDHLGIVDGTLHPGADDNASGVAVLLAAAKRFAASPPRHPLIFAALDGEELALSGAEAFLRAPPIPAAQMALNVNLDMLARSGRREIVAAGASYSPWLIPILQNVQRRTPIRIVLGHDRPGTRPRDDWTALSDHAVFHRAGVPFLYFGVEDHADYHGPGDTAAKIDPVFFGDVADAVLETLIALDSAVSR